VAGGAFDERAIMTLREFLALSRAESIQYLAQYDGNLDAIFASILGS